jgi:DNA-binding beta-propeller fold protein YncE
MAVDMKRQRLFVAELGNDSVGIVDLPKRKLMSRIQGLKEPQGVGYEPSTDMLYVANAGDGSVRLFEGSDYKPTGRIELGNDADNIRIDALSNRVFIGYGSGGLAVIDPATRSKIGDISLKAHPKPSRSSRAPAKSSSTCPMRTESLLSTGPPQTNSRMADKRSGANFPMALDSVRHRALVIFGLPPNLAFSPSRMASSSQPSRPAAMPMTCSWIQSATAFT